MGQLDLFEASDVSEINLTNNQNSFGCCSLYRDCSLAAKCLHKDQEYSKDCTYRKHLENGRIFYTSSATNFSEEKYNKICKEYNSLPKECKQEFNNYLGHFFKYEYLASNLFCFKTANQEFLSNIGFISCDSDMGSALNAIFYLTVKTLKEIFSDYQHIVRSKTKEMKESDSTKKVSYREVLQNLILFNLVPTDKIHEIYATVQLNHRAYFYELFLQYKPQYQRIPAPAGLFKKGLQENPFVQSKVGKNSTMDFGRCRIIENWADWDYSIHTDETQIRRQGYAMTYPFEFKINKRKKTARFSSKSGFSPYDTSLSDCSCSDFQDRALPCKHIYRLAVELGLIEIIKHSTIDKNSIAEIKNSSDIDNHPEQLKRQKSAMDKKYTPAEINYEEKTAIFFGSGETPYLTAIDSCTCRDFSIRRLPCKHIYRLRHELNKLST